MCYRFCMATASKTEPTDTRLVLLIRKSERRRIEKLARTENVSVAEIVRRSIGTYQSIEANVRKQHEEQLMKSTIQMLEDTLATVNESIVKTCKKLDTLHVELEKRAIA
jgi:hypothetical protein